MGNQECFYLQLRRLPLPRNLLLTTPPVVPPGADIGLVAIADFGVATGDTASPRETSHS